MRKMIWFGMFFILVLVTTLLSSCSGEMDGEEIKGTITELKAFSEEGELTFYNRVFMKVGNETYVFSVNGSEIGDALFPTLKVGDKITAVEYSIYGSSVITDIVTVNGEEVKSQFITEE